MGERPENGTSGQTSPRKRYTHLCSLWWRELHYSRGNTESGWRVPSVVGCGSREALRFSVESRESKNKISTPYFPISRLPDQDKTRSYQPDSVLRGFREFASPTPYPTLTAPLPARRTIYTSCPTTSSSCLCCTFGGIIANTRSRNWHSRGFSSWPTLPTRRDRRTIIAVRSDRSRS